MDKSYTEKRIELGQDVNNAWSLVAARFAQEHVPFGAEDALAEKLFKRLFPVVQRCSQEAREAAK